MRGVLLLVLMFLLVIFCVNGVICGDDELDEGEICDGTKLGWYTCLNFSYDGGELGCLEDCSDYDYSNCYGDDICGNGIIDGDELCEIDNVRNRTCVDEGFLEGILACSSNCVSYDTSGCSGVAEVCGNGIVNGTEECDGSFNETCESKGFDFGVLRCIDCMYNTEHCFMEEVIEENLTEGLSNVTVENNSEESLPGVVNVEKKGKSLSTWLLIIVIVLVIGIVFIWFYIFKFKKGPQK